MAKEGLLLHISPINPFTPRQAQVAELRANGYAYKQIAKILRISRHTASHYMSGSAYNTSPIIEKGVYGIIEDNGKTRPNIQGIVPALLGDVLFFDKRPKNYEVVLLDRTRKQIIADLRRRKKCR